MQHLDVQHYTPGRMTLFGSVLHVTMVIISGWVDIANVMRQFYVV
jgi:hypothetical protein